MDPGKTQIRMTQWRFEPLVSPVLVPWLTSLWELITFIFKAGSRVHFVSLTGLKENNIVFDKAIKKRGKSLAGNRDHK